MKGEMRCEVIVATRGEKPANLDRTIDRLVETVGKNDRVRVIRDGEAGAMSAASAPAFASQERPWEKPRGCGQARHYGITTSKAEYVALVDAHMWFPDGWIDDAMLHLKTFPNHVVCTQNQSVNHKWEVYGEIDSGAHLHLHTVEPQAEHYGPRVNFYGLSAKWNKGPMPGPVAAPMGACYVMRRDWYEAIGKPLGILEAWGCDEELLGVCSYLCGGGTYCIPAVTRHMYAAPRKGRAVDVAHRWAGRMAMHLAIPGLPDETIPYMRQTGIPWGEVDALMPDRMERVNALRAHLEGQKRRFSDMIADGLVTVNPPTMHAQPAKVVVPSARDVAGGPVCPRCDRAGMRRHKTAVETLWRCESCGHRRAV